MLKSEVKADHFTFAFKGKTRHQVDVSTPFHRVVIAISSTGRSVRVYLDGKPLSKEAPDA